MARKSPLEPSAEPAPKRTRNGDVSQRVLEFGMSHPGVLIHVNEIVEATGLSASQIRMAIRKMVVSRTVGTWITNLRGSAWTYYPPEPPAKANTMTIEVIAQLPQGLLVRAEDGSLAICKAVRLEEVK